MKWFKQALVKSSYLPPSFLWNSRPYVTVYTVALTETFQSYSLPSFSSPKCLHCKYLGPEQWPAQLVSRAIYKMERFNDYRSITKTCRCEERMKDLV